MRSQRRFFQSKATKEAIDRIAKSENLVLYCGAGTTIDRTGYGWAGLIAEIFDRGRQAGVRYPTSGEIDLLLRSSDSPMRIASLLKEYALQAKVTSRALANELGARLAVCLYQDNPWSNGSLVDQVAELAVWSALVGKQVFILTTNYDTWIEDSVRELSSQTKKSLGIRLSCRIVDNSENDLRFDSNINIVYLHGRALRSGRHRGRLVLDEIDYQKTSARSGFYLRSCFQIPDASVLILGSSLTDPPLIEALAASKRHNVNSKFALVPLRSTGVAMESLDYGVIAQLKRHLLVRGQRLNTQLLMPDFFYQVPQFCHEVNSFLPEAVGPAEIDNRYGSWDGRYGQRLIDWWRAVEGWIGSVDFLNEFHDQSTKFLDAVGDYMDYGPDGDPSDEHLRLELWARCNPESERRLCLVASSAGFLIDPRVRRIEEISLTSTNASMRSFIDGRALHIDAKALLRNGKYAVTSRWKSYLSAPIRVARSTGEIIPVGVITLASTAEVSASGVPSSNNKSMRFLVEALNDIGQDLLAYSRA